MVDRNVDGRRTAPATEPDALTLALERLRLEGAIFLRAEFSEGWTLDGLGGPTFAAMMHPGAERLILFDVIAEGRCWVSRPAGERYWANAGDVLVLPYGDLHLMGGLEQTTPTQVTSLMPPPPWTQPPVVRLGEGGAPTKMVCGCLYSDDILFDPSLAVFPPAFVVRLTGTARRWFDASIAFGLEFSAGNGPPAGSTRLPELLLIEVLRTHLATTPGAPHGWLGALRDPILRPAMAGMHNAPQRGWTVADLASVAAVSESVLKGRFQDVLGVSPIRYLREWRMHLAKDLLMTTDKPVAAVARQVGYEAEEAFSRAFKRALGSPPAQWRSGRHRSARALE
jgi:AraC-like DNA-binding protein